jgi:NAD(P)-dependent dehydrogenase (short-subunit alcohol dehydrogenase family)
MCTDHEGGTERMSGKWDTEQIPDQRGRTAIVTGANSGLGLVTARELARRGATVVLACRNLDKGAQAIREIEAAVAGADVRLAPLDLGDLSSVRAFADSYRADERSEGLDLLLNNAGVMAPPRGESADGYELQFATNVLGHFALTGRLIDLMAGRADARVVTLSSNAHKFGKVAFDDLQSEHRYNRWRAYGQSKLGDLLFALELDRRLRAAGSRVKSVAAHPGYSATNLQFASPPAIDRVVMRISNVLIAQSADMGALSSLYAATYPGLEGGSYIGPDGIGEHRGHPHPVKPNRAARDPQTAARLWTVCEQLTDVRFELDPKAAGTPSA